MPFAGWKVEDVLFTTDEALAIAEMTGSFEEIPYAALRVMTDNMEERSPFVLSPSSATDCPRRRFLKVEFPYYLKLKAVWRMGRGTAVHTWLESADHGITENRLFSRIMIGETAVDISGKPDHYHDGMVTDYKTTDSLEYYDFETKKKKRMPPAKPEHIVQVNLYAHLLEENGYPVSAAQIWYVTTNKDTTFRIVPVPVWTSKERYAMLQELATPIARVKETGYLPDPYPEDYWLCQYCEVRDICRQLAEEGK